MTLRDSAGAAGERCDRHATLIHTPTPVSRTEVTLDEPRRRSLRCVADVSGTRACGRCAYARRAVRDRYIVVARARSAGLRVTALALGLRRRLLGSVHCAAMCGSFACLASGGDGSHGQQALGSTAAYNLGRLFSYVTLGAIAGAAGAGLDELGAVAGVAAAAAIVAGGAAHGLGAASLAARLGVRVPRARGAARPGLARGARGARGARRGRRRCAASRSACSPRRCPAAGSTPSSRLGRGGQRVAAVRS